MDGDQMGLDWNTGQGCPVNPQAGMPALRQKDCATKEDGRSGKQRSWIYVRVELSSRLLAKREALPPPCRKISRRI